MLRSRLSLFPALFILLTMASTGEARSDEVTLAPSKDNTLYEDQDGTVSNGAGQYSFSGNTKEAAIRRALMAFDIAGNIPSGATINSVTLTLYCSKRADGPTTVPQTLYRVLADWGEAGSDASGQEGKGGDAEIGDVTWLHTFYDTDLWPTVGGDFADSVSASQTIGGTGFYSWSSEGMVTDVQAWLDTPSTNYGWVLKGTESGTERARRYNTREGSNVGRRPALLVDYTPLVVSGACCFDDSCEVLTEADCLAQGGAYQGDGTSCSPNPCFVPTGACCLDDGTCVDTTEAGCGSLGGTYQGDGSNCQPGLCPVVLEPFVDALPLPQVAVPTTGVPGGVATYDIAMTEFQQQLHRDLSPTTVWGYAGTYPGPVIEATRDQAVTVNWINDLRDSQGDLRTEHYLPVDLCMHGPDSLGASPRTVVHLHGGHVEESSDGYPEDTILPGEQQTYFYPNNQLPATLWFHDHALGITRLNVMMGLAGFYFLRDAFEAGLNLPSGEFEIPLAIQDRRFNSDGSLSYPATWQDDFFGDKILVNGKVWPFLNVKQGKYRFRVLSGSNTRAYTLSLSTGDPFQVIGSDGGLLPQPVTVDSLTLTSGERADIIVDFAGYAAGTEIILTNSAPAPFPGASGVGVVPNVMKFVVQSTPGHTGGIPSSLRPIETLLELDAIVSRDFVLDKQSDPCAGTIWTINGLHWDDITEYPVLGTTEIWRFINDSGMAHPMHMHLVMFQVLDRQEFMAVGDSIVPVGPSIPPDSTQAGWKDTVPVLPGEMLRVIARFEGYTGKYAYHCHILEHEDHEMMRQFQVVDTLLIAPLDTTVVTGQTVSYSASGGLPPYGYSFVGNPSGGTLNPASGLYTAGSTAGVTDTVRVTDAVGAFAEATVSVVPVVVIAPLDTTVVTGQTVSYSASGGLPPYGYSFVGNPSGGTLNPASGLYTAGSTAGVTDTVRVTDAVGAFAEATVSVVPVVVIAPLDTTVVTGQTVSYSASGGLPPYGYSFVGNPSGGTLNPASGLYTAGSTAGVTDTVRVTDAVGAFAEATVSVVPVVVIAPLDTTVVAGQTVSYSASGGLPPYGYSFVGNPSGGTLNPASGLYTAGSTAGVTDTVRVTDAVGAFAEATVSVVPVVVIAPLDTTVVTGQTVSYSASGGLPPYGYSFVGNPSGGTLNPASGLYTAGSTAGVTDTVRVTDAVGAFAEATVSVVPVVVIAPLDTTVVAGQTVSYSASGGLPPYGYSFVGNPSGGTLNPASGLYTAGSTAGVTDTVRVTDQVGNLADARVAVTSSVGVGDDDIPTLTRLFPTAPNPFGASTAISYALAEPGWVRVQIFGLNGQLVQTLVNGNQPVGNHRIAWNGRSSSGRNVASGMYLLRFTTRNRTETHRIVRLR